MITTRHRAVSTAAVLDRAVSMAVLALLSVNIAAALTTLAAL